MSRILVVTWNGGGNVPPAVGLARELRARGHDLRVIGQESQRSSIQAADLRFEPYQRVDRGSPVDRMGFARWASKFVGLFADTSLADDVEASLDREPADLVVVDAMLLGALRAVQRRGVRHAVLHHTLHSYMTNGFAHWVGLATAPRGLVPQVLWARADVALVPGIAALEPREIRPSNVRLTGPVWPLGAVPSPSTASEDRILVSLSSIFYGGQVGTLNTILRAVADLPAQVVLTTGHAVDPAELDVPGNVEAHGFLPHRDVLPNVRLVVGHGGFSTTLQALAHDLPLVVLPASILGDQRAVGAAVARAGAGVVVRRSSPAAVIRDAIRTMLADGPHRSAAARLGAELRSANGAVAAANEVERVLARVRAHPLSRPAPQRSGPAGPAGTEENTMAGAGAIARRRSPVALLPRISNPRERRLPRR